MSSYSHQNLKFREIFENPWGEVLVALGHVKYSIMVFPIQYLLTSLSQAIA
jgi:hypothetical protein